MSSMTHVELFAGIAGFSLGFQAAGIRTVAHVESDANCRKLLRSRWPDAVILDDVRTAGAHNLPKCDVVSGGFPCQDLSVAGKRAGLSGERSGLFYQMVRIVDELQPAFCVFENVPGLLSSDDGRDFARVLLALDRIGYCGAWRVLDAQWFGVAQRRRRVFGVFSRLDSGAARCAEILSLRESLRAHPAPSREAGQGAAGSLTGGSGGGRSHGRKSGTDRVGFLTVAPPLTASGRGTERAGGGESDASSLSGARDLQPPVTGRHGAPGYVAFQPRYFTRDNKTGGAESCGSVTAALSASHAGGDSAPCVAQVQWASGGGKVHNPTAQALRSGAEHNYQFMQVGMQVRRLTPTECEKLQGFTTNTKRCILSVCLDYQKSVASVAVQCHKWPDNVWLVGAGEKTELVKIAGSLFRNDQESRGALVAVHVRMRSEPRVAAILNQGRLCWSANGAGDGDLFPLSMPPDAFAQQTVTLMQCLEAETDFGKVALPQSMMLSITQKRGSYVVDRSGQESAEYANDVESIRPKDMFITFSVERDTQKHDLMKATLFCSVINAIVSSIPSKTLDESFCLVLDLESDYTTGFADSTRYRMLGNAVAVPVVAWIGRRLVAAWENLSKARTV